MAVDYKMYFHEELYFIATGYEIRKKMYQIMNSQKSTMYVYNSIF